MTRHIFDIFLGIALSTGIMTAISIAMKPAHPVTRQMVTAFAPSDAELIRNMCEYVSHLPEDAR